MLQHCGSLEGTAAIISWPRINKWQSPTFAGLRGTWRKTIFFEKEYQITIEMYNYEEKVSLQSLQRWRTTPWSMVFTTFPSMFLTKVRIVFDCPAKCDGVFRNDVILDLNCRERFAVLICFHCNLLADCPCLWHPGDECILKWKLMPFKPSFSLNSVAKLRNRSQPGCVWFSLELFLKRTQAPWNPVHHTRKH